MLWAYLTVGDALRAVASQVWVFTDGMGPRKAPGSRGR
jgi:hypothetical protein